MPLFDSTSYPVKKRGPLKTNAGKVKSKNKKMGGKKKMRKSRGKMKY